MSNATVTLILGLILQTACLRIRPQRPTRHTYKLSGKPDGGYYASINIGKVMPFVFAR